VANEDQPDKKVNPQGRAATLPRIGNDLQRPATTQPRVAGSQGSQRPSTTQPRMGQPVSGQHDTLLRDSDEHKLLSAQDAVEPRPPTAPPRNPTPAPQPALQVAPSPADEDPYLGKVIADRYKVIDKLGEGGMGVVYLAEHVFIEKRVAVKILSEDFARKADLVARFMQEAKAASKIGHENIIDITDFGETASGSVFFVMEFLDGADLAHHVREAGALPLARVRTIMNQLCRALGAAHAKGIIHRDLKPENIFLIERNGRPDFVKVLDFGIAKMSSLDEGGARLTRTGMIFGTPEYMSPEQAKGDRPDHRVDIYAAGCILYEMLTGDVPFHAETFMGVLTKHMFEQPEPLLQRAPQSNVPPSVEAVVMKALAKDRDQRYQTMKELALALEEAIGGDTNQAWGSEGSGVLILPRKTESRSDPAIALPPKTTAAAPSTVGAAPAKSRGGLVVALVSAGVLVLGGVSLIAMRRPKPQPAPVVAAAPPPPVIAPPPVVAPAPVAVPPPAPPATHELNITSTPAEAEVYDGLERLGVTPYKTTLPESKEPMNLTLRKKGFKEEKISLVNDRNHDFVVPLLPLKKSAPAKAPIASKSQAPAPPEKTAEPPAVKPAGKLRDLKDPFAN
jgi:serine/threonine-protein kinase